MRRAFDSRTRQPDSASGDEKRARRRVGAGARFGARSRGRARGREEARAPAVREEVSSPPRRAARVGCRVRRGVEVGGAHVTSGRNRFGARTFPGGLVGSEDGGAPHEQVIFAVGARAAPIRRLCLDRLEIRLEPQHRSRLLVRGPRHGSKSFSTEPGFQRLGRCLDRSRVQTRGEATGRSKPAVSRRFVRARSCPCARRVWRPALASLSRARPKKKVFALARGSRENTGDSARRSLSNNSRIFPHDRCS